MSKIENLQLKLEQTKRKKENLEQEITLLEQKIERIRIHEERKAKLDFQLEPKPQDPPSDQE